MSLFVRFKPADVYPAQLINRQDIRKRLHHQIGSWVEGAASPQTVEIHGGRPGGHVWVIKGEKGVGKSILTRAVLQDLRASHSGQSLILEVNCRDARSWRSVMRRLWEGLVKELSSIKEARTELPKGSLEAAKTANELVRHDDVKVTTIHEALNSIRKFTKFQAESRFLDYLGTAISRDVEERDTSTRRSEGTVFLDDERVTEMFIELAHDLYEAQIPIIMYLDNVDELDHDYQNETSRDRVRREVLGLLQLSRAPVALVLNVRSYFAGILPRDIPAPEDLDSLSPADHAALLDLRLDSESHDVKEYANSEKQVRARELLCALAPTPYCLLEVVQFLLQRRQLDLDDLQLALARYVQARFTSVHAEELENVLSCFRNDPKREVRHRELRQALSSDESEQAEFLAQICDHQVVLPVDFWNPKRFTLDPLLQLRPFLERPDLPATA
jgi:hypothetical protein